MCIRDRAPDCAAILKEAQAINSKSDAEWDKENAEKALIPWKAFCSQLKPEEKSMLQSAIQGSAGPEGFGEHLLWSAFVDALPGKSKDLLKTALA